MANNTRQIRRQIKSIKNTAKITRAMEMISAVKLQKTQAQTQASRAYADAAREVIEKLTLGVETKDHKLFINRKIKNIAMVVISSNRGLCGSLNSNILKMVLENERNSLIDFPDAKFHYITMGKKLRDTLARMGKNIIADYVKPDITLNNLPIIPLADTLIKEFIANKFDKVAIIYPKSFSVVNQKTQISSLLPFSKNIATDKDEVNTKKEQISYIFEPSREHILDKALIRLLEVMIFQALLETNSAEHASRMVAMKSATDNAKELEGDLSLYYNRTRQSAITQEVSEITAGRLALSS